MKIISLQPGVPYKGVPYKRTLLYLVDFFFKYWYYLQIFHEKIELHIKYSNNILNSLFKFPFHSIQCFNYSNNQPLCVCLQISATPGGASIVGLLQKLLVMDEGVFNLKRSVDSLDQISARTFGLPHTADTQLTAEVSRSVFVMCTKVWEAVYGSYSVTWVFVCSHIV